MFPFLVGTVTKEGENCTFLNFRGKIHMKFYKTKIEHSSLLQNWKFKKNTSWLISVAIEPAVCSRRNPISINISSDLSLGKESCRKYVGWKLWSK